MPKTYPDKEKISKNHHTANCYRKIRNTFREKYIEEKFSKPMWPCEKEFLQHIKKYLNDMEYNLLHDAEKKYLNANYGVGRDK